MQKRRPSVRLASEDMITPGLKRGKDADVDEEPEPPKPEPVNFCSCLVFTFPAWVACKLLALAKQRVCIWGQVSAESHQA